MSDGFSINLKACLDAHGAIDGVAKDLVRLREELDRIGGQVTADWSGQAAQAYVAAQARWTEDTDELNRILFAINRALEESINGYHSADKYGVGLFQGGS